jgi:hypothetical protein
VDNLAVDGHTALDSSVVGKAVLEGLEVALARLVHGKNDVEHTVHIVPTGSRNLSGRLIAPDVLAQMKLPLAHCKFTGVGVCAWRQVPEDTSVDAYASTMSKAIKLLADADWALSQSMFSSCPSLRGPVLRLTLLAKSAQASSGQAPAGRRLAAHHKRRGCQMLRNADQRVVAHVQLRHHYGSQESPCDVALALQYASAHLSWLSCGRVGRSAYRP